MENEVINLLEQKDTVKVIATVSKEGIPHVVTRRCLHAEGDLLVFYEQLQSSQTNRDLVYSIWFHKQVSVLLLGADGSRFTVEAVPEKSITAGREFEEVYNRLRSHSDRADLNAIWYLKPHKIDKSDYLTLKQREEVEFPMLAHLDQLVRRDALNH